MTKVVYLASILAGFALSGCTAPEATPSAPEKRGESRQQEAATAPPAQGPAKSREEAEVTALPTFRGHTKHLDFVAFSADFTKLVTVSNGKGDCTGRIWDARTGRELVRFAVPQVGSDYCWVRDLWFTSDGQKVVTEHTQYPPERPKFRAWDAQTGKLLSELREPTDEVRKPESGQVRGDGRRADAVFSANQKRKIERSVVYEVPSGKPLLGLYGTRLIPATNGVLAAPYFHVIRDPDGVDTSLGGLALSEDGSRAVCWESRYKTEYPGHKLVITHPVSDSFVLIDVDKAEELKRRPVPKEWSYYQLHFFRDGRPLALVWDKEGSTLTLVSLFP